MTDIGIAQQALQEALEPGSFGEHLATEEIPKGVELKFACLLDGYTDWYWQVTLSKLTARSQPTVSEINLLAGEDSLVAPPWVPWAHRLAEYRKARKEQRESLGKSKGEDSTTETDDAWLDVDENQMIEPEEIDVPDLELASADIEKPKNSKPNANKRGVKPPAKTSRTNRVKKTHKQDQNDNPDGSAE